jgi:DNA-binding transcriptional LysR family regulator
MEMHQVRYFLAVTRQLNFTRAAESCNVAQPSLTRAIKQLESELGGELFRRERNLSHLTELGHRVLPVLQQCYDSAITAKSLARSMKTGAITPLTIALSVTVNVMLLISFLSELVRAFPGLELRLYRGTNSKVAELLKQGEAEVGIAGSLEGAWERLNSWPLFTEPYRLIVGSNHRLASALGVVSPSELAMERFLFQTNCENSKDILQFLDERSVCPKKKHAVGNEQDLTALIEGNLGIGIAPRSSVLSTKSKQLDLEGLMIERTIYVYGVAGRQRSTAASTFIKMLRASDWRIIESQLPDGNSLSSQAVN